jgi:hypothetical protein
MFHESPSVREMAARIGLGAALVGGAYVGLLKADGGTCVETCDGDCFIGVFGCESCEEGDPGDCFIQWDSNEQSCYDNFVCHWSCPSCWTT